MGSSVLDCQINVDNGCLTSLFLSIFCLPFSLSLPLVLLLGLTNATVMGANGYYYVLLYHTILVLIPPKDGVSK